MKIVKFRQFIGLYNKVNKVFKIMVSSYKFESYQQVKILTRRPPSFTVFTSGPISWILSTTSRLQSTLTTFLTY